MTTDRPTRPSLQDGLLADLRQAAPAAVSPARPITRPESTAASTPTVELRMTPRRWSLPGLRPAGNGFVLTAGPMRLAVTGFGR